MKKVLFYIFIFTMLAFSSLRGISVVITPSSQLVIKGKTNVNSFKCQYNILKLNKPIPVFFKRHKAKIIFNKTTLVLENADFDCGGRGINTDFQELLKSETHPQIRIKLKEISKDLKDENLVNALLDLELAGVTKSYVIPVELEGEDILVVKGVLCLNIRDFNLEPPKKALGLIVVEDLIEINFQLKVKEY
ncbi:YceI family protein [Flavivirga aquimarina]|uniref:YceI family protein n=1 Tax=Flavivirga aquimarina TaxID=2027862 RepID=A0ABT8WHB1_9FLAO|nr:YceI family protein [Flavivirga aquimarina]MDO5972472.1 YceI family protein [Flavivirga aquimarina]